MSEQNSGAIDDGNGGADNQNQNSMSDSDNNLENNSKEELVPKPVAERFKKDLLKWKDRANQNQAKLDEALERIASLENKDTGDGNDFKAQAERFKRDAEEWKNKFQKAQQGFTYSEKYRAVFGELKRMGLRDEAEDILEYEDLNDLEIETTSKGRLEVHGAKEWAESFYNRRKYLFEPKKTPRVNSTDGRSAGANAGELEKVTPAMVVAAERQAKKSGKAEDMAIYKSYLDKYNKQRKA